MQKPKVCILTSGVGSRLKEYTKDKNKALLTIEKKAAISHIIDNFPKETQFIISIGYKGKLVKDFIKVHHPKINVKFINVKKYKGKGSGPAKSLNYCKKYLQEPFYFVSCDTLWKKNIYGNHNKNWMGCYNSKNFKSKDYCNLIFNKNKITKIIDKKNIEKKYIYKIFVGLAFIKDFKEFWSAFDFKKKNNKEVQISIGFKKIMKKKILYLKNIDWEDIGSVNNYENLILKREKFNFSKKNQLIFISNERVTKFFSDQKIINNLYLKANLNKKIYPQNLIKKNNFISYKFEKGSTLYEKYNSNKLKYLLKFLENNLWTKSKTKVNIQDECKKFYFLKTKKRIRKLLKKYPKIDNINNINGLKVLSINDIFKKIPWKKLFNGHYSNIHGDLQFDNIILSKKKIKLIDWRPNFSKLISKGDLYYDFSKLLGGLEINYDLIKKNKFTLKEYKYRALIKHKLRENNSNLKKILLNYINKNYFNINKVKLITGLIFLNMSPLHHYPFDKYLFYYGKSYLQKILNKSNIND